MSTRPNITARHRLLAIAAIARLRERQNPKPWPRGVRLLARFKRDGERGVGDTLARLLGTVGGEVWKKWYKKLTGEECGCADRQGRLNARFPYGT